MGSEFNLEFVWRRDVSVILDVSRGHEFESALRIILTNNLKDSRSRIHNGALELNFNRELLIYNIDNLQRISQCRTHIINRQPSRAVRAGRGSSKTTEGCLALASSETILVVLFHQ